MSTVSIQLNRNVFSFVLKVSVETSVDRSAAGRLFHVDDPEVAKLLSPYIDRFRWNRQTSILLLVKTAFKQLTKIANNNVDTSAYFNYRTCIVANKVHQFAALGSSNV